MTACWYEIQISEILDSRWSRWFEGMEVLPIAEGSPVAGTLLRGCLPDQAALFGILSQVRNLHLTLIEVRRMNAPPSL
jgi:hypothetical protein